MVDRESESKEDIHNTINYYIHDGAVFRFSHLSFKSKKHAVGGLGRDRCPIGRGEGEGGGVGHIQRVLRRLGHVGTGRLAGEKSPRSCWHMDGWW